MSGTQLSDDRLIIQYLLNDLPEPEQVRLEEQYFDDSGFFELVRAVEDDLIEGYVSGRLTRDQREQFERRYLATPERRERVEFARTLKEAVSMPPVFPAPAAARAGSEPISLLSSVLAPLRGKNLAIAGSLAMAIFLAALSAWFIIETLRLRAQLKSSGQEKAVMHQREQELQREVAEQHERGDQLANDLQREREQLNQIQDEQTQTNQTVPDMVSFVLATRVSRIGNVEPQRLVIPPTARRVQLRVAVEGSEFESYQVEVRSVSGDEIWSRAKIKAFANVVVVTLPASRLTPKSYILALSGITSAGEKQSVGEYAFKIAKR